MKKDKWLETLEQFRRVERPEGVLLVSGTPSLVRILVAWMDVPIGRRKRLTPLPKHGEAQWEWLWRNALYSVEELARRLPFSDSELERKLHALIANKVLYPDGTINGYVARFLRAKIVKTISSTGQKPRKAG